MKMRAALIATLLAAGAACASLSGCTVWGAKNPPTLSSTTSAEQCERLFWAKAREGRWKDIAPLVGPNVVYAVSGEVLTRDQIVPYLQSQKIREFVIGNMAVRPNGHDMTLSYTIQISGEQGQVQSLVAVSVWQQVKRGWILILHAEQPGRAS